MNVPSLKPNPNGNYRARQASGEWRAEAELFKPGWKRAWEWLTVAHRVIVACAAMCAGTIAIHGYLKALELKTLVREAVAEVVTETNAERDARVKSLEMYMVGMPDWRVKTSELDSNQEIRLRELERRANTCESQMLTLLHMRGR